MKTILKSTYSLLLSILTIAACSSLPEQSVQSVISSDVKAIQFRLDYSLPFFGVALNEQIIAHQVTQNLKEWGYKISAHDDEIEYSHLLSIDIGTLSRNATPAGFSFSMGNSDPRALEFQKANVLPFTCSLSSKEQPQNSAEITMEVAADDYSHNQNDKETLNALLIDDLSTICYNLLSELQIETHASLSQENQSTPSWIPSIRIEVENPEQPNPEKVRKNNSKSEKRSIPASPVDVKTPQQEVYKQQTIETEKVSPITIETPKTTTKTDKKTRKRYIIHNQGTPVILKFGHERK